MAQLEDLNRRYASKARKGAEMAEQLETAGSGDFQALRGQLARSKQANADLEKVFHRVKTTSFQLKQCEQYLLELTGNCSARRMWVCGHLKIKRKKLAEPPRVCATWI